MTLKWKWNFLLETLEAVLGDVAPSSAASRPCSRCRTLTLGSLLRWGGTSVILVGGLTSSSSISLSAKFPSGLGTPSRVTMNLGLAESPRSLLMLGNKHKVNVKKQHSWQASGEASGWETSAWIWTTRLNFQFRPLPVSLSFFFSTSCLNLTWLLHWHLATAVCFFSANVHS